MAPVDAKDHRIAELEAQLVAKDAVIAAQQRRIEELERKVAELTQMVSKLMAKLDKNSGNSHLPPSSDGPGGRPASGSKPGGRKRGAQPGHRGHKRELVDTDRVHTVVDIFPAACEKCCEQLPETPDPAAARYQVAEVPPVIAHITEYRGHAVTCACGHTTRGSVTGIVPASPFGPRLMSLIALLTGVYHVSRRQCVGLLKDVLGMRVSLGSVSEIENRVSGALSTPVDEIKAKIDDAAVKHADGTTWLQSGKARSVWTLATDAATLFRVFVDGSMAKIKPFFGACKGILVSDRATVFSFWDMQSRQICWAHLKRKFILFSEQTGPERQFGTELLGYTSLIFKYWHDYRDGKMQKATFVSWMVPLRTQLESCLHRAVAADIKHLSGSCADMLEHRDALWRFVDVANVEPTNNHAERELRSFVLWRKRSFGSQSDRGDVFAERVMSVAHTARKQNRTVFGYLTACCEAMANKTTAPSLFESTLPA